MDRRAFLEVQGKDRKESRDTGGYDNNVDFGSANDSVKAKKNHKTACQCDGEDKVTLSEEYENRRKQNLRIPH